MDMERHIAADNEVNGALAALDMKNSAQLHVWPRTMECWHQRCYIIDMRCQFS